MDTIENMKIEADRFFGFDIASPNRTAVYVSARLAFAKYCYSKGFTLIDIGKVLNRHHSTIIHSLQHSNAADHYSDTKHILYEIFDKIIYSSIDNT